MKAKQRRLKIVEITKAEKKVAVNYLATLFATSKETIRRDLAVLSEKSLLRKIHGGAAALQTAIENPITNRNQENSTEKKEIANYAVSLLSNKDSVFIDAGSTTYALCEGLCHKQELTIVTNSLALTLEVGSRTDHIIYLIGGQYNDNALEVVGSLALDSINRFFCDHAIITVGAINSCDGCMDYNLQEASIAAAMIAKARSVTVLADHTKIGQKALCSVCDLSKISRLVTDRQLRSDFIDALEKNGVELVVTS